jgi:hypothetical protein
MAAPARDGDPAAVCETVIQEAQSRYRLPPGMLFAIGLVESGRADPATHRVRPWPWSVQADGQSRYFASRAEAVTWVLDARATGVASIDIGCMQINLLYHPQAFASVDAAFDPGANVDYAARFLVRLYADAGDWPAAIGFYHSRTPSLGLPYQRVVQQSIRTPLVADAAGAMAASLADRLARAWRATVAPVARAVPPGGGRSWDILLQGRAPAVTAEKTAAARTSAVRSPVLPGG